MYIYIYIVTFPNHNHHHHLLLFSLSLLHIFLLTHCKRGISSRLQSVLLSFHSFVRVYPFPMGRWVVADPWVTCAIASFIALASLYPTVYRHHRILSSTDTPTPLSGCFDYCLWCLRQGYQSDCGAGLTQSVPILRLCSERQNYILK
jgi:hypothetical protein